MRDERENHLTSLRLTQLRVWGLVGFVCLFKSKATNCIHFCKTGHVKQTQLGLNTVRNSKIQRAEQEAILLDKRLLPYNTFPTTCLGVCIIHSHTHLQLDLI